ncbi:MAG: hypothetical protein JST80_09150 [Bdellovibrionales bacterium]|nr:hypothetical protein [Bdellovibrionales bacterium]
MLVLLSILSLSAQAQTPLAPHQAQFDAIRTLPQSRELACPATAPKDGKVLVVFDGMKGFCPRIASATLPLWNEQNRLVDYAYKELKGEARTDFFRWVDSQQNFFHECYLLTPTVEAIQASKNLPPMLYYSLHGANEAAKCLKSLQEKTEAQGKKFSISFLGYSLGGSATLLTARAMHDNGAEIDTVVTVDPVGRNLYAAKAVLGNGDTTFFKRPSFVKYWINFYQHDDHTALTKGIVVPIGIRGSSVIGADVDLRLYPNHEKFDTEHAMILYTDEVTQVLYQMVGAEIKNSQAPKIPGSIETEFATPEN